MEKRKNTYTAEEYLEAEKQAKEAKEKRDKEYKENWDRKISECKKEYDRQFSEVFGKIEKFFTPDGITPEEYARSREIKHKGIIFNRVSAWEVKPNKYKEMRLPEEKLQNQEAKTKDFSRHFENFPYVALSRFLFDNKILKKEFDEQSDKDFFENVINKAEWSKLNEYLVSHTKTKWRCVIHRVSTYIKDSKIKSEYQKVSALSIGITPRQLGRHYNTKTKDIDFDKELQKILF